MTLTGEESRSKTIFSFPPIYFTKVKKVCFNLRVNVVLPLLKAPAEICEKLHISPRALGRWEKESIIPSHSIGGIHRYLEHEVEAALLAHRFGPPLSGPINKRELRERVRPKVVCGWLGISRPTLTRRMIERSIPFYQMRSRRAWDYLEMMHRKIPQIRWGGA